MSPDAKILFNCIADMFEKRIKSGQNSERAIAFLDTDVKSLDPISTWSYDRFREAKNDLDNAGLIVNYRRNFKLII